MAQLSAFAQYHIRKLLAKHLDNLSYPLVQSSGIQLSNSANLNWMLKRLCLSETIFLERLQELENLARVHHGLATQDALNQQSTAQLEARIFEILGIKTKKTAVSKRPKVVPDTSVMMFAFPLNNTIQTAMQYQGEFYGIVHKFKSEERLRAYREAWALTEQNLPCVLTVSKTEWIIWVTLRSPAYPILAQQGTNILKLLFLFQSKLYRCKIHSSISAKPKPLSLELKDSHSKDARMRLHAPFKK